MNINLNTDKVLEIANYWDERVPMMAMEECGELIQAISKYERKNSEKTRDNLVEEIRDLYISLSMLQCHYGISDELIQKEVNKKIAVNKD